MGNEAQRQIGVGKAECPSDTLIVNATNSLGISGGQVVTGMQRESPLIDRLVEKFNGNNTDRLSTSPKRVKICGFVFLLLMTPNTER